MPASQSELHGKGALVCAVGSTLGKQLRERALLCRWHRHRLLAVTAPRGHIWGEQGRAGFSPTTTGGRSLVCRPSPGSQQPASPRRPRARSRPPSEAGGGDLCCCRGCPRPAGLEAVPWRDPSLGLADASPHAGRAALMFLSCRSLSPFIFVDLTVQRAASPWDGSGQAPCLASLHSATLLPVCSGCPPSSSLLLLVLGNIVALGSFGLCTHAAAKAGVGCCCSGAASKSSWLLVRCLQIQRRTEFSVKKVKW